MKENSKISILLTALEERYFSLRIIRERVQTVSLRILGILFAGSGFLFHANIYLCFGEKIFLFFVLWITYYILHKFYFDDLKKGFKGQREISGKIEKLLGFYTKSYFGKTQTTLYPETRLTGNDGNFFRNNNILVVLGFIILTLSIMLYT